MMWLKVDPRCQKLLVQSSYYGISHHISVRSHHLSRSIVACWIADKTQRYKRNHCDSSDQTNYMRAKDLNDDMF